MNIVEFALKFKDLASGELMKFGSRSRQTFAQAQKYADKLSGRNKILGQSYSELQKRIREVENTVRNSTVPRQIREARKELRLLQREAERHPGGGGFSGRSSKGGGGLMGMFGRAGGMLKMGMAGAAAGAVIGAVKGAIGFVGDSIGKGLDRQRIQTSFNVLTGDEQAGGALTKQLVDLQKNTVLGSEVFKNAQTMLGFGFKSTEVLDNLKALGDISMGDKQRFESLTLAFSQARAAGRLMGQDLLQMVNAGFNPLEQLSKTTGKNREVLKDEMSKGLISFAMLEKAFKDATSEGGKYNNMLETIAKTPAGMAAQVSGMWEEIKTGIGMAFLPLVSKTLQLAQKVLPIIEGFIKPLNEGIQRAADWMQSLKERAGGLKDYIDTVKNLFVNSYLPVVKNITVLVFKMVGKLIEFISKSELLKDSFRLIVWFIKLYYSYISNVVEMLKWVFEKFEKLVMPLLNAIEKAYRWIKERWGNSRSGNKSAWESTGGSGENQCGAALGDSEKYGGKQRERGGGSRNGYGRRSQGDKHYRAEVFRRFEYQHDLSGAERGGNREPRA